jgi:hypothetical protein
MRKRAKGLLPSRLTEDNIVEMSICDRGNAFEKDVGKRQFFDRVRYPSMALNSPGRPMRLITTCFASRVEAKPGI